MEYNSFERHGLVRVLELLKAHNTEYLSGQDLSDVLHISRVAVWKHIRRIQELGYEVESRQKLGYRLTADSELLLPWEITSGLGTRLIGQRAFYFDSIDSTQSQALRMSGDPKNDGAVIVAGRQTEGRGRLQRRWLSPSGGIWMSVILHPELDVSASTLFPIAASLALSKAVEKTTGTRPELKWPNDLTIRGKKAAGMLVDASLESGRITGMVLGAGINFDVDTAEIEGVLRDAPNFYGAASLAEHGTQTRPVLLVRQFLAELEGVYDLLKGHKRDRIVSEWTKRSSTIRRQVRISAAGGTISGRAERIEEDGALIVSEGKKSTRVVAGDVTY